MYKNTYELSDDIDLAEHYLNEGFLKSYNPGPDFSTFDYYESNDDVRQVWMNPLVHYELYGRKEKRKIELNEDKKELYHSTILNSQYFDEEWYGSTYGLSDDIDFADHYLKEGFLKNYNPGPDFSTFEYYECNSDVKEWKMNPLVHYEFYGINEHRKINIPYDKIQSYRSAIANSPYFDEEWNKDCYKLKRMPRRRYLQSQSGKE